MDPNQMLAHLQQQGAQIQAQQQADAAHFMLIFFGFAGLAFLIVFAVYLRCFRRTAQALQPAIQAAAPTVRKLVNNLIDGTDPQKRLEHQLEIKRLELEIERQKSQRQQARSAAADQKVQAQLERAQSLPKPRVLGQRIPPPIVIGGDCRRLQVADPTDPFTTFQ